MSDKSTPETQAKAQAEFLKELGNRTLVEYENDLDAEQLKKDRAANADPEYQKLWDKNKQHCEKIQQF